CHAVVRHPLQVEVDMEHREDEPQVDRHRRLPREQALDAAFDRDVRVVHFVVERDYLVRQLDVVAAERIARAPQRPAHAVALALERRLELVELLLEGKPQPNLPVTQSSVRLSEGCVKMVLVWSYSTRMPARRPSFTSRLKNAVMSATRAACCMLCVTITS